MNTTAFQDTATMTGPVHPRPVSIIRVCEQRLSGLQATLELEQGYYAADPVNHRQSPQRIANLLRWVAEARQELAQARARARFVDTRLAA